MNVIAFVQDEWGRNLADHSTTFTVHEEAAPPGSVPLTLAPVGVSSDSVALTIGRACAANAPTCAPADRTAIVTAMHAASGLDVSIAVYVRYDKLGDHGVAASADSPWPKFGIASARMSSEWLHLARHPFFARSWFGKFDIGGPAPPVGDEEAGTVLSSTHVAWRRVKPWGAAPGDMQVPAPPVSAPSALVLKAYYAADAGGGFGTMQTSYTLALQAAADLVSATPVGATVGIQGVKNLATRVPWSGDCTTLALSLKNHSPPLPAADLPASNVVSIYMLADPGVQVDSPRAVHCGPQHLVSSPFPDTHFIVLPAGTPLASTIAHEIGHALGLGHVSAGGGFYDDNLMAESDELSAPMRSRLTIGQAFRAALHPESYIVTSGQAKSSVVDCGITPLQCPALSLDALRRSPP